MLNYLKRFRNVGTIISLASLIGLLIFQFGIKIDLNWLDATVKIVCSILVVLGICNNPETNGINLPINKVNKVE